MQIPSEETSSLFEEFTTRLAAAGGLALIADSFDDVVAIAQDVPGVDSPGTVWISDGVQAMYPGLTTRLRNAGISFAVAESPDPVRDAPLGITVARLAIAETGSVLLRENGLADRSVSLVTQRLVVLCPAQSLVTSLDDAAPVLREIATSGPSYATFVTGPSRTADIERELAVGVQGPGSLHVVFIPGNPA